MTCRRTRFSYCHAPTLLYESAGAAHKRIPLETRAVLSSLAPCPRLLKLIQHLDGYLAAADIPMEHLALPLAMVIGSGGQSNRMPRPSPNTVSPLLPHGPNDRLQSPSSLFNDRSHQCIIAVESRVRKHRHPSFAYPFAGFLGMNPRLWHICSCALCEIPIEGIP